MKVDEVFFVLCRYVFYVNEHRARVRDANPDLSFPAISKILGAEWSSLDPTEKQVGLLAVSFVVKVT